jgi:hypothetical protein
MGAFFLLIILENFLHIFFLNIYNNYVYVMNMSIK